MINVQDSWNRIASHYVKRYAISDKIIHYGPLCPGEDKLKLLGNLSGKKILDLGCGAGQNAIAIARLGARVTAIDFSEDQIRQAGDMAIRRKAQIRFIAGDIARRLPLPRGSFDLIISACAIAFVRDIEQVFRESIRVLKPGGMFVLSDMHPLQYILDENRTGVNFTHSFPHKPLLLKWRWDFEDGKIGSMAGAHFQHYVRSLSDYHNALTSTGFVIGKMLEPKSTLRTPHIGFSREIWNEYRYIASHLPITFIILAQKPKTISAARSGGRKVDSSSI